MTFSRPGLAHPNWWEKQWSWQRLLEIKYDRLPCSHYNQKISGVGGSVVSTCSGCYRTRQVNDGRRQILES